jgi:hypothetical protein
MCSNIGYCPDLLLDRLFSFMFWTVEDLSPSARNWKGDAGTQSAVSGLSGTPPQDVRLSEITDSSQDTQKNVSSDLEHHASSSANVLNDDVPVRVEVLSSMPLGYDAISKNSAFDARSFNRKEIIFPQVFEILTKLLHLSKSSDQIKRCFRVLENSMLSSEILSFLKNNEDLHHITQTAVSATSIDPGFFFSKNLELILGQKDWILSLTDIIVTYRRKYLNSEDNDLLEKAGALSMSESESVGGSSIGGGRLLHPVYPGGDDYFSSNESEDGSSVTEEEAAERDVTISPFSPEQQLYRQQSTQSELLHLRQARLKDLTKPVLEFIKLLVMYDFLQKYTPNTKKWNDLFRLSLPETSNLQEEIVSFLLEDISRNPLLTIAINSSPSTSLSTAPYLADSSTIPSYEAGINLLKNLGFFLEQLLEKMKLSLKFSAKLINVLYSLNYHCSFEMRNKIMKETVLPEVRKNCIIRCLIDVGQDIYLRVDVLKEINSSLQAYLLLNENKAMTDTQIIILILGMFIEIIDDFDFIENHPNYLTFQAVLLDNKQQGSENLTLSSDMQYQQHHTHHPDAASIKSNLHRLQSLFHIIHASVFSSTECRKAVAKVCDNVGHDPKQMLTNAFLNSSASVRNSLAEENSDIGAALLSPVEPITGSQFPQKSTDSASGGLWWTGWSSSSSGSTVDRKSHHSEGNPALSALDIEVGKLVKLSTDSVATDTSPFDFYAFIQWYCALERR